MSFFKSLFGLGARKAAEAEPVAAKEAEHKGFRIRATPFKAEGQYQTSGVISKEIGGVVREHSFIRADRFSDIDTAADIALSKGRQIVDEQGDLLFS